MSKLKLPTMSLGNLFKRKSFDPTQFQNINEEWDKTPSLGTDVNKTVTSAGKFQNHKLPLSDQIDEVKQKLALFDEALPSLKK